MLIIQLREFFIYFNTGKYKRKILPASPYVHVFHLKQQLYGSEVFNTTNLSENSVWKKINKLRSLIDQSSLLKRDTLPIRKIMYQITVIVPQLNNLF